MKLRFIKLQGNGNDFILIDEYEGVLIPEELKGEFARIYCDRRYGIGADGVLFLSNPGGGSLKMRLFQPDASEADMCGNGIRCFAKYAHDVGYTGSTGQIITPAGVIFVNSILDSDGDYEACVDMPTPEFEREKIPAKGNGEYKEEICGFTVYAVNTGVPHAVVIVESVDSIMINEIGPVIRNHASFLKGANVNFVEKTGIDALKIRTYERGVEDETLSCGTGATASAAVLHHLGQVGRKVNVETAGGPLIIEFGEMTRMQGPAASVYWGIIELE